MAKDSKPTAEAASKLETSAAQAAEAASGSVRQIADDLKRVIHEAQQLLMETAGDTFSDKARDARESIDAKVERLRDVYAESCDYAAHLTDDARLRVQERPLAAIGIAAGIGALIGACLLRRR